MTIGDYSPRPPRIGSSKPEKKLQFSDESQQTGPTARLTWTVAVVF